MEPIRSDTKERRSLREWVVIGTVAFVLLILTGVVLVVGYGYAKQWRAHSLVSKARQLLDKPETSKQGLSELMAAYHLEPDDPIVIRGVADFESISRNGVALTLYHKLLGLPGVTRDDRRAAVRGFMGFGDLKTAKDLLDGLMADHPEADDYALLGTLQWTNHQQPEAVASLRRAVSLAPTNASNQLLLAQLLCLRSDDTERREGLEDLKTLAIQPDSVGLQALVTMCQIHPLDEPTQHWTIQQIRKHPLLDDPARLSAWGLEMQSDDPETIFRTVVAYFKTTSVQRKAVAARWLYTEGQPDKALELAPANQALISQDLFLDRLDCLAYEKKWQQVEQDLAHDPVPLSATLLYLYRARAAHELGDDSRSATDWDKAREASLSQPGMLNYAGNYALQLGLFDEAKKTYIQETHIPELTAMGYRQLLQLEQAHGNDNDLLDTLTQMLIAFPNDPDIRNDWAYMSFLLNRNMAQAAPIAQGLVDSSPNLLTYRTTLALCYLTQNDPPGALTVYQGANIDWSTAPVNGKCIYAAVLAANGRKVEATAMLKDVNLEQFRPAERDLLRHWGAIQ